MWRRLLAVPLGGLDVCLGFRFVAVSSPGVGIVKSLWRTLDVGPGTPNGLEMSRPASQDQYRAKAKHSAGRVGSIELLGRAGRTHCDRGESELDGLSVCQGLA
jgi:hypothetical protein